jgi:hypothetical protein
MKRFATTFTLVLMVAACSSGPPEPPPPPPFTAAGVFDVSFDAMGQQMAGTITIEEMDGAYSGSLTTDLGAVPLSDFMVDGMAVTFQGVTPDITIGFKVNYEGDGFVGEISLGDFGSGAIAGVKR